MSALTDELLESYTSKESVNDLIRIDVNQRRILVPSTEIIVGVRGDDRSESKYFALPRMVSPIFDAMDASIYVVWRLEKEDGSVIEGSSVCNERSYNETAMVFEWVVPGAMCENAGSVAFNVHLHKENSKWHTAVVFCQVLDGNVFIDHSKDLSEEQQEVVDDYLENILARIREFQVSHVVVVDDSSLINEHTRLFVDTQRTETYEFLTVEDRKEMGQSLLPLIDSMTSDQALTFRRIWGLTED